MIRDFIKLLAARLKENFQYIQVVIGPRQVGKTIGVKALLGELNGPYLYAGADEVSPPNTEWLRTEWQRALRKGKGTVLVFDEIQKMPHWSSTVKALYDEVRQERQLKVVLLGSASLSLQ
jgi:predicted AAA+ superfamily ATPase